MLVGPVTKEATIYAQKNLTVFSMIFDETKFVLSLAAYLMCRLE